MLKIEPVWCGVLTLCALLAVALSACGEPEISDLLGQKSGFRVGGIQAGPWWLTTAERGEKSDIVWVYIEGDGRAYVTSTEMSGNPTPHSPVGLRLALKQPAENAVVYMARPCQFASFKGQPCKPENWTSGRFDEEVMSGFSEAVARVLNGARMAQNDASMSVNRAPVSAKRAIVVGYSGGAAIALEVAKRVPGVVGVITVAGNIDPAATNAWHGVSAMPTAVRPYQYPGRLATLPVLHLVGSKDEVVPPGLTYDVMAKAGKMECTTIRVVNGPSHNQGWEKAWPVAAPRCGG